MKIFNTTQNLLEFIMQYILKFEQSVSRVSKYFTKPSAMKWKQFTFAI